MRKIIRFIRSLLTESGNRVKDNPITYSERKKRLNAIGIK